MRATVDIVVPKECELPMSFSFSKLLRSWGPYTGISIII
jgi:hypothetical protein